MKKRLSAPVGSSPRHTGFGPTSRSAVQSHSLSLPHSLTLRLHHELRGVSEAVFIHLLGKLLRFMHLRPEHRDTVLVMERWRGLLCLM